MLLAVGSDGNNLDAGVAKRFGHAAFYIVYNIDDKTISPMENKDEDHSHEEIKKLIEKGVKAFIVGNIGPHAFELINEGGAEVYLSRKMTVRHAIDKFTSGQLEKLSEPTVKKSINHA